ncbi:hypothetical protein H2248_010264 [Termitomyces sp. 'cryptogamus']|nr:hypothetical protein H2248_010264 [Termitomyces sp. 'cryptogamus']
MARTYAKLIANLITGPIIVGGWSFGGVAAYEVARHLELLGRITQGILLINAPNPVRHVPLSDSIINTVLHLQSQLWDQKASEGTILNEFATTWQLQA